MIKIFIEQKYLTHPSTEFLIKTDDDRWGLLVDTGSVPTLLKENRVHRSFLFNLEYLEVDD